MNAIIDIQTPAGKSLEGFPTNLTNLPDETDDLFVGNELYFQTVNVKLHPGDTITIKIV